MFYIKWQLEEIINHGMNDTDPLTPEQEAYHRKMADALGMTWEEYLEKNPHLK